MLGNFKKGLFGNLFNLILVCLFFVATVFLLFSNRPALSPTTKNSFNPSPKIIIKMGEFGFNPQTNEISQGDVVVFENVGGKNHWPASNIHPTHEIYPEFDPRRSIPPKENWIFVFKKAGEWKFHDHISSEFSGVIVVNPTVAFDTGAKEATLQDPEKLRKTDPKETAVNYFKKTVQSLTQARQKSLESVNMVNAVNDKEKLRSLLKDIGPSKVMENLLNDSGGGSILDCHQEAHAIGKAAYELYGAKAFQEGNASCHSGYYHGVMEAFLAEKGTADLALSLKEICENFPTQFGKFECLHGVGHGVLAYENYDLPKAIETCNLLNTNYEQTSCYGGVFMENIVTAQGLGAIRGHGTKWTNKDPQFPCNGISQNFDVQYQCYQMQTSWMLTLFNYDFDKVAQECVKVRPDMVPVCFKSLGRDAAGNTLRNLVKIVEICGKVPKTNNYYEQCAIGAVNVIVDFWGGGLTNQASGLCRLFVDSGKRACYSGLAGRLNDVFNTLTERKNVCNTFEKDYQSLCNPS